MPPVTLLKVSPSPVSSGDLAPAKRRSARASHREVLYIRTGGVVVSQLLAGLDSSSSGERVGTGPPQVRIATVVPVVDGLAGGDDEMAVLSDDDRVDVGTTGLPGRREKLQEFLVRDQTATEARYTSSDCDGDAGEQAPSLNWGGANLYVRVHPAIRLGSRIHRHMMFQQRGDETSARSPVCLVKGLHNLRGDGPSVPTVCQCFCAHVRMAARSLLTGALAAAAALATRPVGDGHALRGDALRAVVFRAAAA